MENRPIDRTKKSNRRCGNCKFWKDVGRKDRGEYRPKCFNKSTRYYDCRRDYYNICKCFEWSEDKTYLDNMNKGEL